jgi:orotate phosphoribosyltransferase
VDLEHDGSVSAAREVLVAQLREHALVIGTVVLTSGRTAEYLVDAKRAILRPAGIFALATLVADQARAWRATAVGGMTMGADPIACAALAGGAEVKAFFVRKEVKQHGLARRIEGPLLAQQDRLMVVEDVVTTGGSTIRAVQAVREEGHTVCGVLAICDRLAGGAQAIAEAADAPFVALTTIDEIYPQRPDRDEGHG